MCNEGGANGQTYFITSQRNFSTASGATSYIAIMAYMANTVRKLGFQANVTRCIEFDARLLLLLRALPYRVLQHRHLVLLPPANAKWSIYECSSTDLQRPRPPVVALYGQRNRRPLHRPSIWQINDKRPATTHLMISFSRSSSCFWRIITPSMMARSSAVKCDKSGMSAILHDRSAVWWSHGALHNSTCSCSSTTTATRR